MKKIILALLLVPALSFAESGIKLHALNLGYGSVGVTSTGIGIAYKSFYADYFMLPDETVTFTLSKSYSQQIGALTFGAYVGMTDIDNQYMSGYNLGTDYKMYFQPYVRMYNGIEFSVIDKGAKLSFLIISH